MNKLIKMAFAAICCLAFTQCSDFLDTSSPSNIDDEFVSSSPTETLKILSRGYALYCESCFGAYNWNDHLVLILNIFLKIIHPTISMLN